MLIGKALHWSVMGLSGLSYEYSSLNGLKYYDKK